MAVSPLTVPPTGCKVVAQSLVIQAPTVSDAVDAARTERRFTLPTPHPAARHSALFADIVTRILAQSQPERVLVFGSYARGTEGPDSDVDVLVVEDTVERRRDRSVCLRKALRGLGVPVDVLVATPEDLRRYGDAIGLIYRTALAEGVVVYERIAA